MGTFFGFIFVFVIGVIAGFVGRPWIAAKWTAFKAK
jgi:hypothetical protein